MNVLQVEAIVKGCYECPFTVRTGEAFSLGKKIRQSRRGISSSKLRKGEIFCVRVSLYAKKRGKWLHLLIFEVVGT